MFWDLLIVFMFVGALFWTVLAVLVVRKAGYSGWQGLLFLVPIVNIAFFVWFALAEWPIQKEVYLLRMRETMAEQK